MSLTRNIQFVTVDKFLDEIKKLNVENENFELMSFIANIDWKFLNINNGKDLDRFVSNYGDILYSMSEHENMIPKLCEVVIKYLCVNPSIRNLKPFIFLIWYLFYTNSSIKEDLQSAISHLFPHYYGAPYENIASYVENILELVTLKHFDETDILYKYKEFSDFFIKEMQFFVISELVNYITEFDSRLVLQDLQLLEVNGSTEVELQIKKLDKIICLFFEFINNNCYDSNHQLIWSNAEELLKKIKRIFKQKIFVCNLTKSLFHVHYVLAYMTSLHPSLSKHLCEYLWTLGTDVSQPNKVRCDAIRNLTGYIAKFNFINTKLVIIILSEMFTWCDRLLDETSIAENDIEKHGPFYSIANGALFILLHRHKEIIDYFGELSKVSAFCDSWQLSSLTSSKANVLREFPFREQFPKLCKMFTICYFGFINTIVEEKVLRKPKPTVLAGMPFRYYFLPDSMKFLSKYRISGEMHSELL